METSSPGKIAGPDPTVRADAAPDHGSDRVDMCLAILRYHPTYAGPAIRFKRYAPGLRARGVRMRVVSGAYPVEGGLEGRQPGELLPTESVDGTPVRRVVLPETFHKGRLLTTFIRGLAKTCVAPSPRPDVLQLMDLPPWFVPWLLRLKRAGIPMVYTHTMVRDPDLGGLRWLKDLLWRLGFPLLDRVVVSSGVMRDELRERGVRTPIEVIPNGVDLQRFRPLPADGKREVREALGFPAEAPIILFVGGFLERRKGLDVLAEAWRRIAPRYGDARLVLVGPKLNRLRAEGPQKAFLQEIRSSLDGAGAADRVIFTGRVEAVEKYLQVADVFVFPSRREGMPNVVPEAYACGAAVVMTPFIGLPAVFGRDGEHFVLSERTPSALARSVGDLLDDPEQRRELGARARRLVEERMDVETSLDRYAALYRTLVAGRP